MKIYNKLVRDNIPEIMISNGAEPVTRILSEEEYLNELNKKILEEVNEYLESGSIEELADVEEVLRAILNLKYFVRKFRKNSNRKSFKKRIF